MERNKINELQYIGDYGNKEILNLLKEGDYVICYNGSKGYIKDISKFPYVEINNISSFSENFHIMDIKYFIFKSSEDKIFEAFKNSCPCYSRFPQNRKCDNCSYLENFKIKYREITK